MSFAPCTACARHVRTDERACPFCGADVAPPPPVRSWPGKRTRAAIFYLGATLAGCDEEVAQPYGAPPRPPEESIVQPYGTPQPPPPQPPEPPIAQPYGAPPIPPPGREEGPQLPEDREPQR